MAVDTRPTTLTAVHNYNLRNQGWPDLHSCLSNQAGNGAPTYTDPVKYTYDTQGFYPSNADIIYLSKATAVNDTPSLNAFSPWYLEKTLVGNTPAAKGHFIINAFDRNRQTVSGISGIYDPEEDTTDDRPISVAFYSGRVWYLMPNGDIYYSQVLTDISRADKCYQDADPTAEDINELVATDGGELDISGISQGLKLIPIRAEIAVLGDNGVWSISGEGDQGFTATSQEIRKITSVGALGSETILEAEGTILYWSEGGIYALVPDQVNGFLEARNLTENTIQTFYLAIPVLGKKNARGFYDEQSKKVFWFYNDNDDYDGVNYRHLYNKALILDITTGAFYTYSFDSSGDYPMVSAMLQKAAGTVSTVSEVVTNSGVAVTNSGSDVTADIDVISNGAIKLKFLCFSQPSTNWQYSFAELEDDTPKDWVTVDNVGTNFSSYIETGHDLFEDIISEIEANTVYVFFKRTEMNFTEVGGVIEYDYPSSCFMRAKWQWADSDTSGRWSELQQVYRFPRNFIPEGSGEFDYGFEVIQTINQVRGKGRAISLRFESEDDKDFHLLGWSIPATLITGA